MNTGKMIYLSKVVKVLEKRGLNWCAANLWENWKNLEKRKQREKNARMGGLCG